MQQKYAHIKRNEMRFICLGTTVYNSVCNSNYCRHLKRNTHEIIIYVFCVCFWAELHFAMSFASSSSSSSSSSPVMRACIWRRDAIESRQPWNMQQEIFTFALHCIPLVALQIRVHKMNDTLFFRHCLVGSFYLFRCFVSVVFSWCCSFMRTYFHIASCFRSVIWWQNGVRSH